MGTMILMMVVVVGVVIALGVSAVRAFGSGQITSTRRAGSGRADQELAERFARGEIDETQFTRARAILHGDRPQV